MRQQLDTLLIVLAICASSAFATKCIFCPAGPTPYTPITNLTNCNETNCTKCEITWLSKHLYLKVFLYLYVKFACNLVNQLRNFVLPVLIFKI